MPLHASVFCCRTAQPRLDAAALERRPAADRGVVAVLGLGDRDARHFAGWRPCRRGPPDDVLVDALRSSRRSRRGSGRCRRRSPFGVGVDLGAAVENVDALAAVDRLSSPAPPLSESFPSPPIRLSGPSFPTNGWAAGPPVRMSPTSPPTEALDVWEIVGSHRHEPVVPLGRAGQDRRSSSPGTRVTWSGSNRGCRVPSKTRPRRSRRSSARSVPAPPSHCTVRRAGRRWSSRAPPAGRRRRRPTNTRAVKPSSG